MGQGMGKERAVSQNAVTDGDGDCDDDDNDDWASSSSSSSSSLRLHFLETKCRQTNKKSKPMSDHCCWRASQCTL